MPHGLDLAAGLAELFLAPPPTQLAARGRDEL